MSEDGLMKIQKSDSNIILAIKNIGIAVLVSGTAILFSACSQNNIDKIQAFSTSDNLPIQEAVDFEIMQTDSGQMRYTLKAHKMLRFENEGETYAEFPEGVKIVQYDEKQNVTSTIRADYAKQFTKEDRWEAKNNVVITNVEGDSLKTDHLILDQKTGKIFTEEYVEIIRNDQIITGIGLTSDQNMKNWEIKKPKGVFYVAVDNEKKEKSSATPEKEPEQREIPKLQDTDKAIQFK